MKVSPMEFPVPKRYAPLNYTDEDSLPAEATPQPLAGSAIRAEAVSELDISMTPEKLGCGILKRPEESKLDRRKASRRQVRFHLNETQEESSVPTNHDLTPETPDKEDVCRPVPISVVPESKKPGVWDLQQVINPAAVFASRDSKAIRKEGIRPGKGKVMKPTSMSKHAAVPLELPSVTDQGESCALSTPEYNTTLALGQEMLEAVQKDFDVKRAVEEQLKKSSVTRQSLDLKVGEGMNIPKDQQLYQGLVSLDVSVEQVLSSAVQKIQLAKPRSDFKKESGVEAPNLMMFYKPSEVFCEMPYLATEGLPPLKLQARVKPQRTAFDMYRKLQEWDE
ncbi:protein phosphatase 1 regulatory subunit 35 [Pleurodeles waltl]|uniref:protein phosphatase 1 regulatory subunit 35 n=1 Tax=Pleurodeles waltl TaxID=8319 RepID=UPI0037099072